MKRPERVPAPEEAPESFADRVDAALWGFLAGPLAFPVLGGFCGVLGVVVVVFEVGRRLS